MASLRKQLSSSGIKSARTTNLHYPKHSSLPPGTITEFVWKDYCPIIFRNIQELGDVNHEDYMLSVSKHETLMELAMRGCCGKAFYVAHDERFVIKTLRKSEAKVLIDMLPGYYGHLYRHKNSLLAKYYGLHATRPGTGGPKVYFVVMENMLRTELQLHKRFDLKGSSQGRSATKNGIQQRLTLKDLEFDLCFYLDPSTRSQILEQISLDCKFLEEQGIMDYSLLLGVHLEQSRRDSARRRSCEDSTQIQNGKDHSRAEMVEAFHRRDPTFSQYISPDRPNVTRFGAKVQARAIRMPQIDRESSSQSTKPRLQDSNNVFLFLGIIDFLQSYNVLKKLEHAYKSIHYNPKTISSVNPKLYATRFQDFLCKVFLADESDSPQSDGLVLQNTAVS